MPPNDVEDLLRRYLDNSLSEGELQQFLDLLKRPENQAVFRQAIGGEFFNPAHRGLSDGRRSVPIFQKIMDAASLQETTETPVAKAEATAFTKQVGRKPFPWLLYAVAASVLFLIAGGIYYRLFLHTSLTPSVIAKMASQRNSAKNDVEPGGNKATLTLADGSSISLTDSTIGLLTRQGSADVLQKSRGILSYQNSATVAATPVYNTISTRRGGQFMVVLPDGSKVWLNAASSLRFPTAFTGKDRSVILTGEAYFDISANKLMPFFVQTGNQKLEVLGTQFNIMGYEEEGKIKTTLLAGSVKLVCGNDQALLQPGQQARLEAGTIRLKVSSGDVEQAVAWKNGFFQFHSDDIGTILRQLGRWYDVEIGYAGKIPEGHFSGSISRQTQLSQVLNMLEQSDVHFRITGKKIIVL